MHKLDAVRRGCRPCTLQRQPITAPTHWQVELLDAGSLCLGLLGPSFCQQGGGHSICHSKGHEAEGYGTQDHPLAWERQDDACRHQLPHLQGSQRVAQVCVCVGGVMAFRNIAEFQAALDNRLQQQNLVENSSVLLSA